MSDEEKPQEGPTRTARPVHPALWVLLAVSVLLVFSSFGGWTWGWMMGAMGLWMLLPLLLVAVLVAWAMERR